MKQEDVVHIKSILQSLSCSHGHHDKIKYVNLEHKSSKRFLCGECIHQDQYYDPQTHQEVISIQRYLEDIKGQSNRSCTIDESIMLETKSGLEVVSCLKEDLRESLSSIVSAVDKHYDEFIQAMSEVATKAKNMIHKRIDHEFARVMCDIKGIENNLRMFQNMESGKEIEAVQSILDQIVHYASKKKVADNSLYDLIRSLNVNDNIKNTHLRLSQFGNKYFSKKISSFKSVKGSISQRMKKDEEICRSFIDSGKSILAEIEKYVLKREEDKPQPNFIHTEGSEKQLGKRRFKNLLQNAIKNFKSNKDQEDEDGLGKRKPHHIKFYDPRASFERTFGSDKTNKQNGLNTQTSNNTSLQMGKNTRLQQLVNPEKEYLSEIGNIQKQTRYPQNDRILEWKKFNGNEQNTINSTNQAHYSNNRDSQSMSYITILKNKYNHDIPSTQPLIRELSLKQTLEAINQDSRANLPEIDISKLSINDPRRKLFEKREQEGNCRMPPSTT